MRTSWLAEFKRAFKLAKAHRDPVALHAVPEHKVDRKHIGKRQGREHGSQNGFKLAITNLHSSTALSRPLSSFCATAYMEISASTHTTAAVGRRSSADAARVCAHEVAGSARRRTVLHRLADVAARADGVRLVVGEILKNEIARQNSAGSTDCLG